MHPLIHMLLASGPVLTDGAWGTQLQARGLAVGEFPEAWNLTHPDRVCEVAAAYVQAGSQIILTNTFGANRLRLADHALTAQVREINCAGVKLSRQGAGGQALVFASIGPSGKLVLTGDVTPQSLFDAFSEQAGILAESGADALVIETMSDLTEATEALRAAKQTGLPVVACMVFDAGKDKDRTMMGSTPEQVAQVLTEAGADVIGANCGQGIAGFVSICRRLRAATTHPIWIKANAGIPDVVQDRVVYRTTPEEFASVGPALCEAGAAFVGGCCGTAPDYIRALKRLLS